VQALSTRWHFALRGICNMHMQCIQLYKAYIHVCCHSNKTRAPISNLPNSAQLRSTPYHSPSYIRVRAAVCAMGMRRGTDGHTRYTQMAVTIIHFASSMTHAKYNQVKRQPKQYKVEWLTPAIKLPEARMQWTWRPTPPAFLEMRAHCFSVS